MNFDETAKTIGQLLELEQNATVTSRDDLDVIVARRAQIWTHIHELEDAATDFGRRARALPELPDMRIVDWAQAILTMKNLCVLVLDATSLEGDVIRIHARLHGALFDWIIRPERELTANSAYTGIKWDEIKDAPTLKELWPIIHDYLSGYFMVGYNLPWIEQRLKDNISYYGLKRLPFRGDCLQKRAKDYFDYDGFGSPSLSNACQRIGYSLPRVPLAADRALGILKLLEAMGHGITSVKQEIEELDDHPF